MDIRNYWDAVFQQDAAAIRSFFLPTAQVRWHCTNECFTVEEFIRANCEYPGRWDGAVERIETVGDLIITAVRVFSKDDGASFHAVSFLKVEGDRISAVDEYWGDDGPPPQWRQEKRIGIEIRTAAR